MNKRKVIICMVLMVMTFALTWGAGPVKAQVPVGQLITGANGYKIPDYFATPNWANSPPLTKFVDTLAPLGCTTPNNLGQCIPIAVPDQDTYPGSDYYEIELVQYRERLHQMFGAVTGDKTTAVSGGTKLRGYRQTNPGGVQTPNAVPHYLGPQIIAYNYDPAYAPGAALPTGGTNGRPVRIKFTNSLPSGNLFLPVDTTIMGSGAFEINYNPETKVIGATVPGNFSQNRGSIHLHGGRTPWISDGTAHQWTVPVAEAATSTYPKGVSAANVPDMWFDATTGAMIDSCKLQTTCAVANSTNNPGGGKQTYYYTNQQSARLLFYHDHAWGITRLNVYAGEAAGYLITDPVEQALVSGGTVKGQTYTAGTIPATQIPLIIQDKTFVNATLGGDPTVYTMATDPTWAWGSTPGQPFATPVTGDLWWPHVYMPAQNPFNPDLSGASAMGRWHYGPWFFPSTPTCGSTPQAIPPFCIANGPVNNEYAAVAGQPPLRPGTTNPSWGAEAFLDTMLVNGTVYPTVTLGPQEYRFRILNASHDRFLNLQLYRAVNKNGYTNPTVTLDFTGAATDLTEVAMVPAAPNVLFPDTWPADGREGGVPNPNTRGPAFMQIGTEGGFLPKPVVLPNQPVQWNLDPTMFNVGNVLNQRDGGGTLFLGPAERADVIVDFSSFAGQTLILYNDAPTAFPALDPHYDYYTGAPDRTDIGGYKAIPPGVGPNIRTVMQIVVTGTPTTPVPDGYNATRFNTLTTAFAGPTGAFQSSQDPIVVGQTAYNDTYATTFPATWPNWGISRISDGAISFQKVDGTIMSNFVMKPKAIHDEMGATFDDYGRMSAKLGLERPFTNAAIANFILQNFVDPATEIVKPNEIQIWRITHNGVDTHPIHFHLFDVQVLNRVGWDGFMRLPDDNELGWKDTVRISPLEDTIVAFKPADIRVPFTLPNSIRPLHPAMPIGSTESFSQIDPADGGPLNPQQTNQMTNFGHEYTWHCHILSHEENDMMRPMILNTNAKTEILWRNVSTGANLVWYMDGVTLTGSANLSSVGLDWTVVGRGDFNSDGNLDILWRNTVTGENVVWYMNGTTVTGSASLSSTPSPWTIVGVGDFNRDSKSDVLWRNTVTGQNVIWYMNGVTFSGSASVPSTPAPWAIEGISDFNGDGNSDILWRNTASGDVYTWYMNGVAYTGAAYVGNNANLDWTIVGTGDLNNDVNSDIIWRNTVTGENMVWFLNGATPIGTGLLTGVGDTNWQIVGH